MNRSIFLAVNRFAKSTPWAHAFMAEFAVYGGIAILALMLLFAWWSARASRPTAPPAVAAVLWAALGTVIALLIGQAVAHAVAELRPYDVLAHVEVLVPRTTDYSFPSDHATVVGGVIAGLWFSGRNRWWTWCAAGVGIFLAFARIYVGAHYPGDVIAGLALGAAVVIVFRPIVMPFLTWLLKMLSATPLGILIAADRPISKDAKAKGPFS